MKLTIKRCHTCRALGVGPHSVKLWPFEGRLYCRSDYKLALTWESSRDGVVMGIKSNFDFDKAVALVKRWGRKDPVVAIKNWEPYIRECAELASWALAVTGDRRTFVHYFSRAVWAWALKEDQDAVK